MSLGFYDLCLAARLVDGRLCFPSCIISQGLERQDRRQDRGTEDRTEQGTRQDPTEQGTYDSLNRISGMLWISIFNHTRILICLFTSGRTFLCTIPTTYPTNSINVHRALSVSSNKILQLAESYLCASPLVEQCLKVEQLEK